MNEIPNRTETIAEQLRDDILRGDYKPGERLPAERDLASRLGVNRGSLREALKQLEQLGLVAIRRGDGTTVRDVRDANLEVLRHLVVVDGRIDRAVFEQLLDAYEMLLAGACYLAVERASPEMAQRARSLVRKVVETPEAPGIHQVLGDLTELIERASGNLVLRLFRNAFYPALLEVLALLKPFRERQPPGVSEAVGALDEALAERDPEATQGAIRTLCRLRREWITKALDVFEASSAD